MQIHRITGQDEAWDHFVCAHPEARGPHLSVFSEIINRTFGHEPIYLRAEQGGEVRGILPLVHMKSRLFGNFLVSVPFLNYGGICAADHEARHALLEKAAAEAQARGAAHIEFRHIARQIPDLQCKSHKVCMLLELTATADALWAGFKSKLRNQIRRPEKDGIIVRSGSLDLLDAFYAVFAVNMRDLGTPVYAKKFFANILQAFPQRARIVAAFKANQPVAAGFLLGFRETMEIPWASSLRAYNRLSPNMLMYWHALKLAIEEGYRRFDFGRSTPDEGTYRFKAQWGAQPLPLHWEYWMANGNPIPDISPKNGKYAAAIRMWQRLPVPVTRLIGPSIVKNIP